MSDLTERLRLAVVGSDNGAKLRDEAADRIEELEAVLVEIAESDEYVLDEEGNQVTVEAVMTARMGCASWEMTGDE